MELSFYKEIDQKKFLEEIKKIGLTKCFVMIVFDLDKASKIPMNVEFLTNETSYRVQEEIFVECYSNLPDKKINAIEKHLLKILKDIFGVGFNGHKKDSKYKIDLCEYTSSPKSRTYSISRLS